VIRHHWNQNSKGDCEIEEKPLPQLGNRPFHLPLVGLLERYEVGDVPKPIRDACRHRWTHSQRPMNLDEVVCEVV
jgi:hypothetical protein